MPEHEPLKFPVLGEQADARRDRITRRRDGEQFSVEPNLARVAGVGAEDEPHRLGAAGAHEPGDRQDLTAVNHKRHVAHRRRPREVGDLQAGFTDHGSPRGKIARQFAAHHQLNHLAPGDSVDRPLAHVAAVAEHHHPVGNRNHLFQPVGDGDDADPLPSEVADDVEQSRGLVTGERRGRLVHHDDPGIERKRLGDLDELLLRRREPSAGHVEVDVHAQPGEEFCRPLPLLAAGDEARPRLLLAEEDVLHGGQPGNERELLVHDGHARRPRVVRRAERRLPAVDRDRPLVGPMGTAEHLHERALARAVLAQQREHLAGREPEIHPAERLHAGERLHDARHLEQRRRRRHTPIAASRAVRIAAASGSTPVQ